MLSTVTSHRDCVEALTLTKKQIAQMNYRAADLLLLYASLDGETDAADGGGDPGD